MADSTSSCPQFQKAQQALLNLKKEISCFLCDEFVFPVFRCVGCFLPCCRSCRSQCLRCFRSKDRNDWVLDKALSRVVAHLGASCSVCNLSHAGDYVCSEEEITCTICRATYRPIEEELHQLFCEAFDEEMLRKGPPPSRTGERALKELPTLRAIMQGNAHRQNP